MGDQSEPIRWGKRNSTSGNRESCQSKDQEIDQKCKVHSSEVLREKVQTKYVVQYKELSTEHTVSDWEVLKRKDQLSDTEKTGGKFLTPANNGSTVRGLI